MKRVIFICILCTAVWGSAQETLPREYQPDEFVSLNSNLNFDDAIALLSEFSSRFENKIIVNSQTHNFEIGVVVDHMHWKRALEYIVRYNNLSYQEFDKYFEIGKSTSDAEELFEANLETREIEINAVFFDLDYEAASQFGIDWTSLYNGQVRVNINALSGQDVLADNYSAFIGLNRFVNVGALIKTFENYNKGKVISNPQIRIMDGEQGKIKVGSNFYLTTRDFAGNTRFSEYEAGTILTVRPKIIEENEHTFIHLDIKAEKSDVVETASGVTKKITEGLTKVLLLNGEETALAGLYSNERVSIRKGIPVLKDLPWWVLGLRYLTGYNSVTFKKKELVILIRAEIVPSLSSRQIVNSRKRMLKAREAQFNEKNKVFDRIK